MPQIKHKIKKCAKYQLFVKGTRIQSQLLFFMKKSSLYVEIAASKKKLFHNSVLNFILAFYFHCYNNVTITH